MKSNNYYSIVIVPLILLVVLSFFLINKSYYTLDKIVDNYTQMSMDEFNEEAVDKIENEINLIKTIIDYENTKSTKELNLLLKEKLNNILLMISSIYESNKDTLSSKELKKLIIKQLSKIRYNQGRGYLFVVDYTTGDILHHVNKKLIGTNIALLNIKDIDGSDFFKKLQKQLKDKEIAYSTIHFYKPNDLNTIYKKTNSAFRFKPFNLLIGTGEYLDVITDKQKQRVLEEIESLDNSSTNISIHVCELLNIKGGKAYAKKLFSKKSNKSPVLLDSDKLDASGIAYRENILKNIRKEGHSLITYHSMENNSSNVEKRIIYTIYNKDWNWLISSEFNFKSFNEYLIKLDNNSIDLFNNTIKKLVFTTLIATLILLFSGFYILSKIRKRINTNQQEINNLNIQLDEEKRFLNNILDTTDSIVAIIDTNATMIMLNKKGQELTGTNIQKLQTTPYYWLNFLQTSQRDKIRNIFQKGLGNRYVPNRIKMNWLDFESNPIPFEWSLTLSKDKEKKIKYLICVGINIKDREIQEKELKIAKNRALEANKTKSQFLANIGHEIRTPLNGIIGLCDIVLKNQYDFKTTQYLNSIKESSTLLANLISDILDFNELESKDIILKYKEFNLQELIQGVINLNKNEASKKSLVINLNIEENIPKILIGDDLKLAKILNKIVHNAVKFTKKGFIDISIHTKKHRVKYGLIELIFEIKDSGIGIEPDKMVNIFKPFVQIDNSLTREYEGSGLGLVIIQDLITKMGGKIEVKSEKERGTIFTFNLKFDLVNKKTNKDFSLAGKKFLVVDDDENYLEILKNYLLTWKVGVKLCTNAYDGWEACKKTKFDYFIVDAIMPEINGIEFVRELVHKFGVKESKILIMNIPENKYINNDLKNENLKITKILTKPFNESELFNNLIEESEHKEIQTQIDNFLSKNKALLVEDNKINQIVAEDYLLSFGLEVKIANSGKAALKLMKKESFDIIFMDIQMPEMDGYTTSKLIREFNKEIPIIALSANIIDSNKQHNEAAMNGYLNKPIEIDKLKEILHRYLNIKIQQPKLHENKNELKLSHVDIDTLIGKLKSSEKAYSLLLDFADSYKECDKELSLKNKEFKVFIHTLKGCSGNLSINGVYTLCCEIYKNDDIDKAEELIPQLQYELQESIKEIKNNIKEKTIVVSKKYTNDEIDKNISNILAEVSNKNFIAQNRINILLEQIVQLGKEEEAKELRNAFTKLDYKKITLILSSIKS